MWAMWFWPCGEHRTQGHVPLPRGRHQRRLRRGTPAFNVNRLCGSGLQAIVSASQSILLGDAEVAIGGGAENMSRAPFAA